MPLLDRDEYVEQAYFFGTMRERMADEGASTQELLHTLTQELLATTKLPMALEFMEGELRHTGGLATAMARLAHYFTAFQTFLVSEAEEERGRFDFRTALLILQQEADYRSKNPTPQGVFVYQFEVISRHRLGYDRGLSAVADDPIFDPAWQEWIRNMRHQIGVIDFADLLYVRSANHEARFGPSGKPVLFGEKEGRIAAANRHRDPLYLFAALQRHLGYPSVPRPQKEESDRFLIPALERKIERLETRIKLMEEELRGGINLAKHFVRKDGRPPGVE